jgi:metal-responsive CopG/Arc/MetJ family transcriptional regulator
MVYDCRRKEVGVMENETEKKRVQVIMPDPTIAKLDKIAQEYQTSRSQAVTIAVREFNLTKKMDGWRAGEK